MSQIQDEVPAEARQVIEDFMTAFNAKDHDGVRDSLNFPHTMMAGDNVDVSATKSDFVNRYENLGEEEGWHHSILDNITAIQSSVDKVHFKIDFSRCHEDGTVYKVIPGLWITTLVDGKWGIQIRSMFR